ncbi:MAG: hypothetical protein AVDCRST_MAG19-170 [uncultured Thermomicrobiales bacterium]|uniref:Integral membrane protein n=1 Tax=uncultured Thermomicrobiales bacterium TaxID=1645740 RepID=A0A6J4U947_9BACT|nr:MAG: hypothetical protein AVDCRST_MAG19-170 [uncultured Thermomicrobiales bacterium]
MIAALLALAAAAAYGASDFVAGVAAKRLAAVLHALWSQAVDAVLVGAPAVASRQGPHAAGRRRPGRRGGGVGAAGMILSYRAMALGPTSVAVPLAASGAAVPVVAGFAGGDPPGPVALLGLTAVILGLVLALVGTLLVAAGS